MTELTAGGNCPLPTAELAIRISAGGEADISAFRLYADGKVRGDEDMIFYGQTQCADGSVRLVSQGRETVFALKLAALPPDVQKVAFTATVDGQRTIQALQHLTIQVEQGSAVLAVGKTDMQQRPEAALILGECYRRDGNWKFRFVAQGFQGGLRPLAEYYGVDIVDEGAPAAASPTPPPAPASTVNLSKVTLTKANPTISLAKPVNLSKAEGFGRIRVNLNWSHRAVKRGFFGREVSTDLDLAAYIKLKNGEQFLVQALGDRFGEYSRPPYVRLLEDDRSGRSLEGEWLEINGAHWDAIAEIVIYTFIYEGAANWAQTDAVVTLHLPHQPPIETRLTEGDNKKSLCAIARLENRQGEIQVQRLNDFFTSQKPMDEAYGWGFRWTVGRK